MKNVLRNRYLVLALALLLIFGIAQQSVSLASEAPVSLRLIFYGDMSPRRDEFFKNEFHEAILNDLNIDLSVETISWGQTDTLGTMLASGEDFAMYCILPTVDWASKGYLAKIDESLVEEYLPNLLAVRGETNGFECCKYKGDIYMVPFGSKPYSGRMQSFQVRNDILKSVGFEADDIDTYDELLAAIDAVRAAYPDMRVVTGVGFFPTALNSEISDSELFFSEDSLKAAIVNDMEAGDKVYSYYETEFFGKLCNIVADWQARGYVNEDLITNPSQGLADWQAGNCLMVYGTPAALIDLSLNVAVSEAETKLVKLGDMPKLKTRDYDWGIAIGAAGQDKVESWLQLFDWIYASQENYEMCVYGVEGVDYERAEDGMITKLVTDSFWDSWFLEATKYKVYEPGVSAEAIAAYESYDDDSILSKAAGFTFDTTNVATEVAAMNAVYTEFLEPMSMGLLDYDSNIESVLQKLRNAGLDKYLEEYQKQFSEWYNNK